MDQLENGMEVYTEDGLKAEYLGKVENGHLVAPYVEAEDWESGYYSKPLGLRIVERVFKAAPVEVFEARIKELKSELAQTEFKLEETKSDILDAQKERLRLVKKLSDVPALRRVEDFLEGRMTHFVMTDGYGENSYPIITPEQLKERNDGRNRDTKLLTLFGDTKGDLQWRVNVYSDGSGGSSEIIPCVSQADAEEQRVKLIQRDMAEAGWRMMTAVEAAMRLNIPIPAETLERYRKAKRAELEHRRDQSAKDVARHTEIINTANEQLKALEPAVSVDA